jgi:hypothetical protein
MTGRDRYYMPESPRHHAILVVASPMSGIPQAGAHRGVDALRGWIDVAVQSLLPRPRLQPV